MDRTTGIFVDGMGAAAATSGILNQLQGRIFGLLCLQPHPLSLEEIAIDLEQSKSNISVNIRGLVDWHLVRRTRVAGSRKDHYEAAADLWLVFGGLHVGLATRRVRAALVARLGEVGFTAFFSVVATAFFTLLVRYYAGHRLEGSAGLALGHVTALRWALMAVIVFGVVLAMASLVTYHVSPMALFTATVRPPRALQPLTLH